MFCDSLAAMSPENLPKSRLPRVQLSTFSYLLAGRTTSRENRLQRPSKPDRAALPALAILEGLSWRQSLILAGLAECPERLNRTTSG
jgi:hypothetical protein